MSLRKIIAWVAALAGAMATAAVITAPTAVATNGFGDAGHSHFDVHPYANEEVRFCYRVIARAPGASAEFANFPMRIQDGVNNYELRLTTTGLQFVVRVKGVVTPLKSTLPDPHLSLGAIGQDNMFDVIMIGPNFTIYSFAGGVRGAELYHYTNSQWPTGVAFSYYTIGGTHGQWDFVHARPLDSVGSTHDINYPGIEQDALKHPKVGSEATFDSPVPGNGGEGNLIGSALAGLASGTDYTYTLTVTGAGPGSFDTRDPGTKTNTVFWAAGWTRFTPGSTTATLKRYTGSGTVTATATAPFGGPGTYRLAFTGSTATLTKSGASGSLITTGNNTSGIRVRANSWSTARTLTWTGTVAP